MIKIQYRDKRKTPFWVMEKSYSIGADPSNHLVIEDPSVEKTHARLINQGDAFLLRDMSKSHNTYVNDQHITQKHIACGDSFKIGDVEFIVVDPIRETQGLDSSYWSLIADSSWLSGQEFALKSTSDKQTLVIGRSNECDIVIPGTHLSRMHLEVTLSDSKLFIRDLGSANGTFVNDKKVKSAEVHPGDRIRLDVYSFKIFGPGIELPKSATASHPAIPLPKENTTSGGKSWKTRPTSPGNREMPNYETENRSALILSVILILTLIFAVVYLFTDLI